MLRSASHGGWHKRAGRQARKKVVKRELQARRRRQDTKPQASNKSASVGVWEWAHLNCRGVRLLHHGCPAQRQRTLLLSRRRGILRLKDMWQVLSRCTC